MHATLTYPIQSSGRFFTRSSVRGYCFGFNGQMKDDEVYGEGNAYAFEYRIHDARLGRFLSVDPLTREYPFWTSYSFAGNSPIRHFDLEGLEPSSNAPNATPPPSAATGMPFVVYDYTPDPNNLKIQFERARYYNVSAQVAQNYNTTNNENGGLGRPVAQTIPAQTRGWHTSDGPPGPVTTVTTVINSQTTQFIGGASPQSPANPSIRTFTVPGNPGDAVTASFTYDSDTRANGFTITNVTTGATGSTPGLVAGQGTVNNLPAMSPGDQIQITQTPIMSAAWTGTDTWSYTLTITTANATTNTTTSPGTAGFTNDSNFMPVAPAPTIVNTQTNSNTDNPPVITVGQ